MDKRSLMKIQLPEGAITFAELFPDSRWRSRSVEARLWLFFDSSFLRILTWIVFDQVTGNNSSTLPSCSLPRAACHVFGFLLNLRPSLFCSGYNNTAKRITHRGVEVRPIQPPLLSLNLSSWPTPIQPSQNKFFIKYPIFPSRRGFYCA